MATKQLTKEPYGPVLDVTNGKVAQKKLAEKEFEKDIDETLDMMMQTFMMAMMLFMLIPMLPVAQAVQQYVTDRTSLGGTENFELDVSPSIREVVCANPSQSLYVINDGPGEIYVIENTLGGTPTHLYVKDEMENNFETHKLLRFYIWSGFGTSSRARAKVKY